jgi:MFS family permease
VTEPAAAAVADEVNESPDEEAPGALDVFRNRPFLLLWLSQAFTQIGANMVMYGLTVIILEATSSNTAVALLILTFLGPAVLFSAVAGVYVDRFDKRVVLVVTNLLRGGVFVALYLVGDLLPAILLLNMLVSTITVFFAPAEAAMIPTLVPRKQLLAANGVFTLTLNAAFAIGFALLGPVVVTLLGAPALILVVAGCYFVAAVFCWTLPSSPPVHAESDNNPSGVHEAEEAMGSTFAQLREGIAFIRANPMIKWSLIYLGIAASLVGVLGVLGPRVATASLGLKTKDFVVVVLPLGFGIVTGILALNSFGHLMPRRRLIEGGLVVLGILILLLAGVVPVSRFVQRAETATGLVSMADFTSLLGLVVLFALLAGIAYAFVAIPAQTQLQEDIPEEARGRVFGILNMLVSMASFLPLLIVAPISDFVGTTTVLYVVAVMISISGVVSYVRRGPLKPSEARATAKGPSAPAGLDLVAVATATEMEAGGRRASRGIAAHDHPADGHESVEPAPADGHEPAEPGLADSAAANVPADAPDGSAEPE